MRTLLIAAVLPAVVALAAPTGYAEPVPSREMVSYKSANVPFFRDVFAGRLNDNPVELEGELFLPAGEGPFPVVVWQHGSAGPAMSGYHQWTGRLRAALAERGIGFFVADSYSGRGIPPDGSTGRNQRLSSTSRILDGWSILMALAKHPRVDKARVGIAGASFGGLVANWTSYEHFAKEVLPDGLRYAAHIPMFPPCGARFERYESTGAPVLFLLGEKDDGTPASMCVKLAGEMKETGAKVESVVYPGAHHGFVSSKPVKLAAGALNTSKCGVATVGRDGERYSQFGSTKNMSWRGIIKRAIKSGCVTRGYHVGRGHAAAEDSLKRAVAFFTAQLAGKPGE